MDNLVLGKCHFSLSLSVVSMSIKNSADFYVYIDEEIGKLFLQFIWTCKGPRIARKILKEQHEETSLPDTMWHYCKEDTME